MADPEHAGALVPLLAVAADPHDRAARTAALANPVIADIVSKLSAADIQTIKDVLGTQQAYGCDSTHTFREE